MRASDSTEASIGMSDLSVGGTQIHQRESNEGSVSEASIEVFRTTLQKLLQNLVGASIETKPRPFENSLRIAWGGGSCYISSALQLLFASRRLQLLLAGIAQDHALAYMSSHRKQCGAELWDLCTRKSWLEVQEWSRRRPSDDNKERAVRINDVVLAITYASVVQSQ